MSDQPLAPIDKLMAENGRLHQELATLQEQFQQLSSQNLRLEATLEAEKLKQNLVEIISDAVITTDNEFRVTSWNHAAEIMYGWKEEEVLGQSLTARLQSIIQDERLEEVREAFLAKGYWKGRAIQHKKDGTTIPILSAVTALKIENGIITGSVAVNRDITDQMEVEKALRERTQALETRNEELAQFAYAASHDLQEPLRMITAYLQLLSQRYEGQLDKEADEFIGYAVDGAKRMRQLITDLLAYSRVEQGNRTFTELSLEKILQQALLNLDISIQENQAIITHDPLPTVTAEKTQMLQLFQNLLSNAIKFRKQEAPLIHISAHQEKNAWVIRITDNGLGIDPKQAERIFTIFHRLHTQQEYPGTGIGLAICKKIVLNHGGTIWVESEPEVGSTFAFTLPMTQQQATEAT